MIGDPSRRGRALAEFFVAVEPRLYADLEEAGLLPDRDDPARAERMRDEWACFALYACVRGLIAAGGFNRETAVAIEALHEHALASWWNARPGADEDDARRRKIAERYAEYGAIGRSGGASAAATVTRRLGEAAARHMREPAGAELAEMVGALHQSLAEGSAEAVRRAE